MRPRISIRAFVRPSVRRSVPGSVRHAFLKNREFNKIQGNSTKFNKIQQNSRLFATVGRVTALFLSQDFPKISNSPMDNALGISIFCTPVQSQLLGLGMRLMALVFSDLYPIPVLTRLFTSHSDTQHRFLKSMEDKFSLSVYKMTPYEPLSGGGVKIFLTGFNTFVPL